MAYGIRTIAQSKGDELALADEMGATTWAQFDARVNRLVHALRARGLERGGTVVLLCGNRREFFEVNFAAMCAGLVVVPVNWHWVAGELAYVIGDSGADALVADGRFAAVAEEACQDPRTSSCGVRIMIGGPAPAGFEDYEDALAACSAAEPGGQSSGGVMFYTSGTTGFPKGVRTALTQTGGEFAAREPVIRGMAAMLGLPEDGVTLLDGPAYHSVQWALSIVPLSARASTVVMRHQFDPAQTLRLIDEHAVTNVHMVPTQFIRLLRLPDQVRAGFDGRSLVTVLHGAAPCPVEVKRRMLDWWGPVISEYYGGTEAGFLTVISGKDWLARPGSLGRPFSNVELLVVGDDGRHCQAGEEGQIYFKSPLGDFVYHKAPEKTAAAHLEPGVGTLGDVGYLDGDGWLFMSDRKIDMIISGGVNIYPAEIEGVLAGHPAVADVAVFGIPDDEMGEQVKAAVELTGGTPASAELAAELIAYARKHLAGYKAPKTIDFEERLPRSPTGKLHKRLLRDPYWQHTGRRI